jgi:hypothetical protein
MKTRLIPRSAAIAAMVTFAGLGFAQSLPVLSERFVDVPGAKIFYKDSGGRGVPVVFLHAYTGSAEVWGQQTQSSHVRVIGSSPTIVVDMAGQSPTRAAPFLLARTTCSPSSII